MSKQLGETRALGLVAGGALSWGKHLVTGTGDQWVILQGPRGSYRAILPLRLPIAPASCTETVWGGGGASPVNMEPDMEPNVLSSLTWQCQGFGDISEGVA